MGLWPTQGDEKRLLFSDYCPSKHRPSLCHLDRSAAQWRDLRFGFFMEMFFYQRDSQRGSFGVLFKSDLTLAVRLYAYEGLGR
jgi:hypothetical protein